MVRGKRADPNPGAIFVPHGMKVAARDRLYIVQGGQLCGFATIQRMGVAPSRFGAWVKVGEFHPCTLPCKVRKFRGLRYRWWDRSAERPA